MTSESSNRPNLTIYSKKKRIKLVKGEGLIIYVAQAHWGSLGVQSRASCLSSKGNKMKGKKYT